MKRRLDVTVDDELVEWVDEMIKKKRFAHRSHAVNQALYELKKGYAYKP